MKLISVIATLALSFSVFANDHQAKPASGAAPAAAAPAATETAAPAAKDMGGKKVAKKAMKKEDKAKATEGTAVPAGHAAGDGHGH